MKTMVGKSLKDLGFTETKTPSHLSVKEAVFPFTKFPGVDVLLGPEMKSTGEVMGIDADFGWAFAKSQSGAGSALPKGGTAFISVKDSDRPVALEVAKQLKRLGFEILVPGNGGLPAHPWVEVNGEQGQEGGPIRGPYQERAGGVGRKHREQRGVTCRFIVDPPGGPEQRAGLLYDHPGGTSGGHGH
jgi:hypothetical protein